jgi:hypothetical protein
MHAFIEGECVRIMSVCLYCVIAKKVVQKYYIYYFFCYTRKTHGSKKKSKEKRTCTIKKPKRNSSELGNQNKIGIDMETEGSIKTIGWKRPV